MSFLPGISQYRKPLKDFIISSVDAKGAKHLKLEAANLISPHFSDEETFQHLQTHMNYLTRTQACEAGRGIRDRDGIKRPAEEPKTVLPPGSRGWDFVGLGGADVERCGA